MDEDEYSWRYKRLGPIDQGRLCDQLAKAAVDSLPAPLLPPRWVLSTPEEFVVRYGGGPWWSRSTSSQLFLVNGFPLFRVWTNANAPYALVDLRETLVGVMKSLDPSLEFFEVPGGSLKKCKPFSVRFRAATPSQIEVLVEAVRRVYGLRNA